MFVGAQDAIGKRYMSDNTIFADAFNFLIYDGEPVIMPDELTEVDTTEIALPSLHEMMLVEDERLFRVIPNYFVNLIAPARMDDADFEKFHTDLGIALKVLKYQDKGADQLVLNLDHRKVGRSTAEFLNVQARLGLVFEEPGEEGEIDMCKAMETRIRNERQDAMENVLLQNIKMMMKNLHLTLEQTLTALEVPVADQARLASLL